MCEALMEIMKKDIDKKVAEGVAKGWAEGEAKGRIEESVQIYRGELKKENKAIITKIQEKFSLAPQIAESYVLAEK